MYFSATAEILQTDKEIKMLEISKQILDKYQVRKTKKQKLEFISFLKQYFPNLKVEEGGLGHNRNIVIGDVSSAKVILSAHYDTCAVLPFPNLIMPRNFLFTILYALLICIPFFVVMAVSNTLMYYLTENWTLSYYISFILMFALIIYVFMLGKPNKHTANDNTSGIITLLEIYGKLSEDERKKVAFVFFDNEENGLLGSSYFRKLHKQEIKSKLLINFDCVSDGDNILLVLNKATRKYFEQPVKDVFKSNGDKTVYIHKDSTTFYPSDQMGFPINVAVSALNKNRILGLYMNRIHTSRDTVFDERNIEFISDKTKQLIEKIS